ncbi:MAG: sensor domain-containing protein [Nocardioides sp.]|nr:sensor domain-containing protein [Nocardioides sp.]
MTEPLTLPMTSDQPAPAPVPPVPPSLGRRVLLDSGYNLAAFVIALPAFVVTVMGIARGVAHVERLRMRSLLGRPAPSPAYAVAQGGSGGWRRVLTPLRDPQSWLDLSWGIAGFITGTIAFVVTLTWWSTAVGGLSYWFWQQWIAFDEENVTLAGLIGFGDGGPGAESLLYGLVGLVALVTGPLVLRLAATVHAGTASVLLCSRAELQGEVRRIAGGRDAARVAEAAHLNQRTLVEV